tara:strand:+ start:2019 stop:2189 length:171 start_codon:yes stop_codon:yes gene_type:complete
MTQRDEVEELAKKTREEFWRRIRTVAPISWEKCPDDVLDGYRNEARAELKRMRQMG